MADNFLCFDQKEIQNKEPAIHGTVARGIIITARASRITRSRYARDAPYLKSLPIIGHKFMNISALFYWYIFFPSECFGKGWLYE